MSAAAYALVPEHLHLALRLPKAQDRVDAAKREQRSTIVGWKTSHAKMHAAKGAAGRHSLARAWQPASCCDDVSGELAVAYHNSHGAGIRHTQLRLRTRPPEVVPSSTHGGREPRVHVAPVHFSTHRRPHSSHAVIEEREFTDRGMKGTRYRVAGGNPEYAQRWQSMCLSPAQPTPRAHTHPGL